LNEIQRIEKYLTRQLPNVDRIVFEAELLINDQLRTDVEMQQYVYDMIHLNGQMKLRNEIKAVHDKLFSADLFSDFRKEIYAIYPQA